MSRRRSLTSGAARIRSIASRRRSSRADWRRRKTSKRFSSACAPKSTQRRTRPNVRRCRAPKKPRKGCSPATATGMAETTYIEAITQAMSEEMARDENVFLIGEDVGAYGGAFKTSNGLIERFGAERVIDTPISEIAIVGAASGAALMGMRPIAEMQFIDFITCAYDMLVNFTAT